MIWGDVAASAGSYRPRPSFVNQTSEGGGGVSVGICGLHTFVCVCAQLL